MTQKQRLHRQLEQARQLSEKLLADFHSPAEWTHQVHPEANHALWFVGHMANTDNFFLSILAPTRARKMEEFHRLFGVGSVPTADPAAYPPPAEVLAVMRERRESLLAFLEELSEESLSQATPAGAPDFLPDFASVFETAIWHEGRHSGQLTLVRRSLGHPPLR
jgi:uncharacterized damage-inducible protein DinB